MSGYEAVIGLEVHAQLRTRTKLFCGCSTSFGAPPNQHVCPVCLGLPGALPVPNAGAVELALRAIRALGCQVRDQSRFARKSYFYPDLAKGYQISQFELPLGEGGELVLEAEAVEGRRIGITRIHMEEDAAKNLHGRGGDTVVDFNRAGVPLIEIVSEPDLRSAAEAEAYLRQLREILLFLGVNDGNLEEGSFRCDANVSVRPVGQEELGTRVELKNINSFRFVRKALEHEIARQEALAAGGGAVVQETRHWDDAAGLTKPMRGKEEAMDYRYFPDPDLPPLSVGLTLLAAIDEATPELPAVRRTRWMKELGLTAYDASVLGGHPGLADYFQAVVASGAEGKKAANFILAEVLRELEYEGASVRAPAPATEVGALLALVDAGTINGKIAKKVFASMCESGRGAEAIVDADGLAQVTDAGAIEAEVRRVVEANPAQRAQYRAGKTKVLGFFVGQVMKATRGQANPGLVNEVLRRVLSEE